MSLGSSLPEIRFSSWDNREFADPIGTRHLVNSAFAYDKLLGTGCENTMAFNGLRLFIGQPFVESNINVLNFSFPNFGDLQASGFTTISNMKLWLPAGSGTVFTTVKTGSHFQFEARGEWIPNIGFPSGAGQEFSDTLPSQFNVRRIDGSPEITGFSDTQVSEWIYLRIFLDADFPVGTYGICGSGLIRMRLTYDFH